MRRRPVTALIPLFATACGGAQSALAPAGKAAEDVATLFWWMVGGAAVVWLFVVAIGVYAIVVSPQRHDDRKANMLIIGGGVVFPTVVLAILLAYGLSLLPGLLEPAPEGSLRISVSGEQWWWRVRYEPPEGQPFELANEIRLPVGEPVELLLESPDVIHSFWIPALGGKVDMIPGRKTRLKLEPTRTGRFRGVCAEYCGASHAKMMFDTVVHEREEFDAWMARESSAAEAPRTSSAAEGQRIFLETGCGACHTIRGTEADGLVGPDLTHVGSRISLGSGILHREPHGFIRWISNPGQFKPGVHMPAFGMLPEEEIRTVAAYLEGLE